MTNMAQPTRIRARDSVFWRLALLVALFCCAMVSASEYAIRLLSQNTLRLNQQALTTLESYASKAQAMAARGPKPLQDWLDQLMAEQNVWASVLDNRLQPLGLAPLTEQALSRIRFARHYRTRLSPRGGEAALVRIPLPGHGADLLMNLPEPLHPWRRHLWAKIVVLYVVPILLSLLFCALLYRLLVWPLKTLSTHTLQIDAANLAALPAANLLSRKDELGALGRALQHLANRLGRSFEQQRQLLRDLSHELRTPLSRLQVAAESCVDDLSLRTRVQRETLQMRELVDRTLELAWLDRADLTLSCAPVDVAALWEVLAENALFESGWAKERLLADIPEGCQVWGELNALAQALENILRNAMRHSPSNGCVHFSATRVQAHWQLSIRDYGQGVAEPHLECLFDPFVRLDPARTHSGFGLGLAIARRAVQLQNGTLSARNARPGLEMLICLQSV